MPQHRNTYMTQHRKEYITQHRYRYMTQRRKTYMTQKGKKRIITTQMNTWQKHDTYAYDIGCIHDTAHQ